jgi:hypothetical protein
MVMIYSPGSISGAHFNPAVTVAFTITGKFPVKEIAPTSEPIVWSNIRQHYCLPAISSKSKECLQG